MCSSGLLSTHLILCFSSSLSISYLPTLLQSFPPPQLLQNLTYTKAVKVHVVCNGQEMVPFRQWNMAKFLE